MCSASGFAGRTLRLGARAAAADGVPRGHRGGTAGSRGEPQQRPLVPAHRDHHQRHGQRLPGAAGPPGAPRVHRPAAAARVHPGRRRHPGILLSRSRRAPPRDPPVPARQGGDPVARHRTGCSWASTTPPSWSETPNGASRSIATSWASASLGEARTAAPSRTISTTSRAPASGSPRCGPRRGQASSSSNTCTRWTGGRIPTDARANDLIHWQTTVVMSDPEGVAAQATMAGGSGLSRLAGRNRSDTAGVLIRDPDGHAVHLVAP